MVRWRTGGFGVADLPPHAAATAWLCPEERDELDGLRLDKRKHDWLLGRVTLKALVVAMLHERRGWTVEPAAVRVEKHRSGAPFVTLHPPGAPAGATGSALPIAASISHSSTLALTAAAWIDVPASAGWTVAIGADVEQVAHRSDLFVDDFMTDRERREWLHVPTPYRDTLANLMWSAKESVTKALQTGLRVDTRWLTCLPDTVPDLRVMASLPFADQLEPDDHDWRRFHVEADARVGADHVALSGRWRTGHGFVQTVVVGAWTGRGRSFV